jgi:DNA-binding transcriptional ArsR family regulator
MVVCTEEREAEVDRLFHALADRTRRDILRRVCTGEHSVSALAEPYAVSFAAVQKHVAVLEEAGLVHKRRHGRERLVRADVDAILHARHLLDELETLWRDRIDRMSDVLTDPAEGHRP